MAHATVAAVEGKKKEIIGRIEVKEEDGLENEYRTIASIVLENPSERDLKRLVDAFGHKCIIFSGLEKGPVTEVRIICKNDPGCLKTLGVLVFSLCEEEFFGNRLFVENFKLLLRPLPYVDIGWGPRMCRAVSVVGSK